MAVAVSRCLCERKGRANTGSVPILQVFSSVSWPERKKYNFLGGWVVWRNRYKSEYNIYVGFGGLNSVGIVFCCSFFFVFIMMSCKLSFWHFQNKALNHFFPSPHKGIGKETWTFFFLISDLIKLYKGWKMSSSNSSQIAQNQGCIRVGKCLQVIAAK